MDTHETVKETLRRFVKENLLYRDTGEPLDDDASFLEKGLIDSTGVVHLVTFLEERFSIRIGDDEVVPDNLDSIARIARYVGSKQNGEKVPIGQQVSEVRR